MKVHNKLLILAFIVLGISVSLAGYFFSYKTVLLVLGGPFFAIWLFQDLKRGIYLLMLVPFMGSLVLPSWNISLDDIVIAGIIGIFFLALMTGKIRFVNTPLSYPIGGLTLLTLISLFYAQNIFLAVKDLFRWFLVPYAATLCIASLLASAKNKEKIVRDLVYLALLVSGIVTFYGIITFFIGKGLGTLGGGWIFTELRSQIFLLKGRVQSFFTHPNFLAEYLVVCIPLTYGLLRAIRVKWKVVIAILWLCQLVCLILTYSRAGFIGALAGLLIVTLFFKKRIRVIILGITLLIICLFSIPAAYPRFVTIVSPASKNLTYAWAGRPLIWKTALFVWSLHPLGGTGLGNFMENLGLIKLYYPHLRLADYPPHSIYLQMGAELGIFGLLIFLWFLGILLKVTLKVIKNSQDGFRRGVAVGFLGSLTGIGVMGLGTSVLIHPRACLLFWVLSGIIFFWDFSDRGKNELPLRP